MNTAWANRLKLLQIPYSTVVSEQEKLEIKALFKFTIENIK